MDKAIRIRFENATDPQEEKACIEIATKYSLPCLNDLLASINN